MTGSQGPAKAEGWTDNEGEGPKDNAGRRTKKKDKPKKDFDPRTDKLLDIASNEDYLMDSLQNFKPPAEQSVTDKSMSVFGERQDGKSHSTHRVIAGVKLGNMVEDNIDDVNEIRQLQDPNFQASTPYTTPYTTPYQATPTPYEDTPDDQL